MTHAISNFVFATDGKCVPTTTNSIAVTLVLSCDAARGSSNPCEGDQGKEETCREIRFKGRIDAGVAITAAIGVMSAFAFWLTGTVGGETLGSGTCRFMWGTVMETKDIRSTTSFVELDAIK